MSGEDRPERLGRYRILRRIGAGGMAEVFLAKSTGAEGIEKQLVVKRVLPSIARSPSFVSMFVDEAKLAMRLNHSNIVQVYAFDQEGDEFLLAMEFVDGVDLGRLMKAARSRAARIPPPVAAYIIAETARGLDYAHNRKDEQGEPMEIVHRDVSPQNLLLSYEGFVKVADFGIAKARLISEETGVIKGKFAYMSPEQALGKKIDRRSDVYALGVLLAELLMGRKMHGEKSGFELLEEVRQGKSTTPRAVDGSVPEALDAICARALHPDPEKRTPSARVLARELGLYLHSLDDVVDHTAVEKLLMQLTPQEQPALDSSSASRASDLYTRVDQELRERRHVAIVSGALVGTDGERQSERDEELVRVLSEMAYKADAVLVWPDDPGGSVFHMLLGLGTSSIQDTLHALRLALDLEDAVAGSAEATESAPTRLALGVCRGMVATARDARGRLLSFEPVGASIALADGLRDAAKGGQVLVAGSVERMGRRTFSFSSSPVALVEIEKDGSPASMKAWALEGVIGLAARVAGAGREHQQLIGRVSEQAALSAAYQSAVDGRRMGAVTVLGELGLGKSNLVEATLAKASPEPFVVRYECNFESREEPFAATAEIARVVCFIPEDASPSAAVKRLKRFARDMERKDGRALMAGFAPLLAPADRGPDERDMVPLAVEALAVLIKRVTERQPLVVFIDGIQWMDIPSLEVLRQVAQRNMRAPALMLLGSRPDQRVEQALSAIPRLELSELSPEDVSALVTRELGAKPSVAIERAIYSRAGGNPYFITELLETMLERGVLRVEDKNGQRTVVRDGVIALPATLEGVLAAKLADLVEGPRRVARWLAVAGAALPSDDLGKLAGAEWQTHVKTLIERGLAESRDEGARYSLANALVRHVAYESIHTDDRARMHRRVADVLRARGRSGNAARIARHLLHAGDRVGAADAFVSAADAARAVYSTEDAFRFYSQALSLMGPGDNARFEAHVEREQLLRSMGRRVERAEEIDAMRREARTPKQELRVLLATARLLLDDLDLAAAEPIAKRAVERARAESERSAEIEAMRLLADVWLEQGKVEAALQTCSEGLARVGVDETMLVLRVELLIQRARLLRLVARLPEARDAAAEALVISSRLRLRRQQSLALNGLGVALALLGSFEDAIVVVRTSLHVDRLTGDRTALGVKMSNLGQLHAELGSYEEAQAFLERSLQIFERIPHPSARVDALCALAEVHLVANADPQSAERLLDIAKPLAAKISIVEDRVRERTLRALLELRRERFDAAEAAAREASELSDDAGLLGYHRRAASVLAYALAQREDKKNEAKALAEKVASDIELARDLAHAERVHHTLAQTFDLLADRDKARGARDAARAVVNERLASIRDPHYRQRYLASPMVREIRGE